MQQAARPGADGCDAAHFPIMMPAAQKGRLNSDSIRLAAVTVQNSTKAFQATANVAEYTVSPVGATRSLCPNPQRGVSPCTHLVCRTRC